MTQIHPTAIVDARAELASSVTVGPYAVIGPGVQVGEGTRIGSHVTIDGPTVIGRDNVIHAHAALGCAPQDMKYRGEPTSLEIGDRNTIREYCTFNCGTVQDAGVTRIGDDNWFMAYVHVAHDVHIGSHCILANAATCGGHVTIGDWAVIGACTGLHQFCRVGRHAMIGGCSKIVQDVPPFMTAAGNPLAVAGYNAEGLRRRGFSRERIALVKQIHRLLYRDGLTLEKAREAIAALQGTVDGGDADVAAMLDFLAASTRGIVR